MVLVCVRVLAQEQNFFLFWRETEFLFWGLYTIREEVIGLNYEQ